MILNIFTKNQVSFLYLNFQIFFFLFSFPIRDSSSSQIFLFFFLFDSYRRKENKERMYRTLYFTIQVFSWYNLWVILESFYNKTYRSIQIVYRMILTTMVKISMKTYHIINNEKKIQRSFIAKSKDSQIRVLLDV